MIAQNQSRLFSEEEHESFKTTGYVRLDGAVPPAAVRKMYERIWALLEAKGIKQADRSTWPVGPVGKLHSVKHCEPSPEDSPSVRAALDAVFADRGWARPASWGQPLVTFPQEGAWLLPNNIWHFDHRYFRPGKIWGANVFLFIDDVEPGGGGTVVVRSSPLLMDRLLNTGRSLTKLSEQNKAFLGSHPWLRGLKTSKYNRSADRNHHYMREGLDIDGIRTRVVELTGKAGDAFVCHPALCHAPAPNVADRPRLMRTQRVRCLPHEERESNQ